MDAKSAYVDADITRAEMLPPDAFRDSEFLEKELEAIFNRCWLLAPTPQIDVQVDLAIRGNRVPLVLLNRPYFVRRDATGQLTAFANICTHAGHTLVAKPGPGTSIVCPQHGRKFDSKGEFVAQPGMPKQLPNFPRPCDHLKKFPAAEWGPLLFLSRHRGAPELRSVLAPIMDSLGQLPFEELRPIQDAQTERKVMGNWKLHACNYLDSLHIPFIHGSGGLAAAVHLDSYRTEMHGEAVLQWAYAKDPQQGFEPDLLPERFRDGDRRVFALWWYLWPNIALNFYPWGLSVNVYMPRTGEPETTDFHWMQWSWDDAKVERIEDWHMADVDAEDVEALAQVTAGLRSDDAVRGRFAPDAEVAPHWFHRRVYESLFA